MMLYRWATTAAICGRGFLLIELKTGKRIDDAHTAQCLNYLKATGLTICLLINVGPRVEIKRLRR